MALHLLISLLSNLVLLLFCFRQVKLPILFFLGFSLYLLISWPKNVWLPRALLIGYLWQQNSQPTLFPLMDTSGRRVCIEHVDLNQYYYEDFYIWVSQRSFPNSLCTTCERNNFLRCASPCISRVVLTVFVKGFFFFSDLNHASMTLDRIFMKASSRSVVKNGKMGTT